MNSVARRVVGVRTGRSATTVMTGAADLIEREWSVDDCQVRSLVDDLRRSDDRTRFALGVARTGIWEAELITGQMEWSETMPLVMGCAAADCGGTIEGLRALVHPDDRDKLSRIIHGNFDDLRDFQVDVRVPWPNGAIHWVQLRGRIRQVDPMSIQLLGVAQDITEYKELELQLRQAQKMEAMGRLAGGVAHDFNNILTAILGYAVLIEGDPIDEVQTRSHAAQITKAANRAATLSRQLLAFSRRQVIERRVVCVADIVTDLLPMLGKILSEQIRVEREFATPLHTVFADRGQLEQIVLNLAINARDAMPNGGELRIKVSNAALDEGAARRFKLTRGDYVLLAVSDTGTGMDSGTCGRIFEPFFTTKDADHGTGLGLATVYEIVKSIGGGIRVASTPGEGTTFRVLLPKSHAATVAEHQEPPTIEAVIGGGETVLLVEDEESVRTLATSILQRNGYVVLTAAEAGPARRLASESDVPIHLVLTDVMMPDGTGPELVAGLCTKFGRPRALYMSGYAGAVLARQGRLAVDSAFLQKPFTGTQLLSRVRQILDAPAT
ncbi:MAG: ATP-binding protein [Acidobacteriota bacterium]|nr:ATP-binding protein [Acidobacteriota bacterium]